MYKWLRSIVRCPSHVCCIHLRNIYVNADAWNLTMRSSIEIFQNKLLDFSKIIFQNTLLESFNRCYWNHERIASGILQVVLLKSSWVTPSRNTVRLPSRDTCAWSRPSGTLKIQKEVFEESINRCDRNPSSVLGIFQEVLLIYSMWHSQNPTRDTLEILQEMLLKTSVDLFTEILHEVLFESSWNCSGKPPRSQKSSFAFAITQEVLL